jgi:carboxyl-terminal processing protease
MELNMRAWVMRGCTAAWLLSIAILLPQTAPAQVRFAPSAAPGIAAPGITALGASVHPLDDLLRQGMGLEAERRWGEALTLYEDALRNYPRDQRLESRFADSKIHYDLGRRFGDTSYRGSLHSLTIREALDLYGEVLLKIEANYVDAPRWNELIAHSTHCLEVALYDPTFSQSAGGISPADAERFIRDLRHQLSQRRIVTRSDARNWVQNAAALSQQQLGVSPTYVALEYVCGATQALDDYSGYLTADQLTDTYSQIDGNFVGLGVELKAVDESLEILKVIANSPAERSGIRVGDRIVAVDNDSTRELTTDQAADRLQGPEGSLVEVTLVSPGEAPRRVRVRREHVEVPSIDVVKLLDPRSGVGYMRLTCFQKNTARDLDAALLKLHNQGMRSLVIDLRRNPGGLLTAAVEVVDKFVESGVIVSTRGRNKQEDYNYSAHKSGTWRTPLVVLIDGDSASASEIFAGAIRDHRRGTIVGRRSYGKGSVQQIIPLSFAHAGMRLTTAKFYSPAGRPFSKVGVEPDVVVQETARPITDASGNVAPLAPGADDPVIERAITIARGQLARRTVE